MTRHDLLELRSQLRVGPRVRQSPSSGTVSKSTTLPPAVAKLDPNRKSLSHSESDAFRSKWIILAKFEIHMETLFKAVSRADSTNAEFAAEIPIARMNAVMGAGLSDSDVALIESETTAEARGVVFNWLPQLEAEYRRIRLLPFHPRRQKLMNCFALVLRKLSLFVQRGHTEIFTPTVAPARLDTSLGIPDLMMAVFQDVIDKIKSPAGRDRAISRIESNWTLMTDEFVKKIYAKSSGEQLMLAKSLAVKQKWKYLDL